LAEGEQNIGRRRAKYWTGGQQSIRLEEGRKLGKWNSRMLDRRSTTEYTIWCIDFSFFYGYSIQYMNKFIYGLTMLTV
jgi:hypothetical protein